MRDEPQTYSAHAECTVPLEKGASVNIASVGRVDDVVSSPDRVPVVYDPEDVITLFFFPALDIFIPGQREGVSEAAFSAPAADFRTIRHFLQLWQTINIFQEKIYGKLILDSLFLRALRALRGKSFKYFHHMVNEQLL
jgi:hypothetical protein